MNSFSQIQVALLKGKPILDSRTSQVKPEDSEKLSRAIKLCEEICSDIEKACFSYKCLLLHLGQSWNADIASVRRKFTRDSAIGDQRQVEGTRATTPKQLVHVGRGETNFSNFTTTIKRGKMDRLLKINSNSGRKQNKTVGNGRSCRKRSTFSAWSK